MKQVSITRNDKSYSGTYITKSKMIYVTHAGQTKPAHIGSMDDQMLAEMILGEMIDISAA